MEVEAANFVQRRKAAKVDYFVALRLYEIFMWYLSLIKERLNAYYF